MSVYLWRKEDQKHILFDQLKWKHICIGCNMFFEKMNWLKKIFHNLLMLRMVFSAVTKQYYCDNSQKKRHNENMINSRCFFCLYILKSESIKKTLILFPTSSNLFWYYYRNPMCFFGFDLIRSRSKSFSISSWINFAKVLIISQGNIRCCCFIIRPFNYQTCERRRINSVEMQAHFFTFFSYRLDFLLTWNKSVRIRIHAV